MLGRHAEALLLAQQVIGQPEFRDLEDDALWLVSRCAESQGDLDQARDALRTFAT